MALVKVIPILAIILAIGHANELNCWPLTPGTDPHNCCKLPTIDRETLEYKYETESDDNQNWSLNVQVSWDEPVAAHDGYGVCLVAPSLYTALPYPGFYCRYFVDPDKECDYKYTNSSEYTFVNTPYGHQYFLLVRVAGSYAIIGQTNVIILANTELATMHPIETPDCYEETGDMDYCKNQPIPIAGRVTDVTIEPFYADDTSANVVFTWRDPVQVTNAGDLGHFRLRVYNSPDARGYIWQEYVFVSSKNLEDNTYTATTQGLQQTSNFSVSIEAGVVVQGEGLYGSTREILFNIPILERPPTTQSPPTTSRRITTHQPTTLPIIPMKTSPYSGNEGLGLSTTVIAASGGGAAGGIILIIILIVLIVRAKKRAYRKPKEERLKFVREFDNAKLRKDSIFPNVTDDEINEEDIEAIFVGYEMKRSQLELETELGSGQFGVVYKGFAAGLGKDSKHDPEELVPVAVKELRKGSDKASKLDFLDEIKLIIEIGSHQNIVSLLGCVTVDEPYHLITEFMEYGDLQHFLWKCREEKYIAEDPIYVITDVKKVQMAHQIARGMDYLATTRYYHGDLAARNILVGKDMVCKISDFGMAEDIYMRDYKRLGPERKRPVKWVSLETNTMGRCSIQSDVWSYGIVLYEIYTLGGVPYPTMDGMMVVDKLLSGYRMEKPKGCPDNVYDVMLKCWSEKPDDRPSFHDLYDTFDKMLASQSGYLTEFEMGFTDEVVEEKTSDEKYVHIVKAAPTSHLSEDATADDRYTSQIPRLPQLKLNTHEAAQIATIQEHENGDYMAPMEGKQDTSGKKLLTPTDTYTKTKLRREVSNDYVTKKALEKPAYSSTIPDHAPGIKEHQNGGSVDPVEGKQDTSGKKLLTPTDTYTKMKLRREVSNDYITKKAMEKPAYSSAIPDPTPGIKEKPKPPVKAKPVPPAKNQRKDPKGMTGSQVQKMKLRKKESDEYASQKKKEKLAKKGNTGV